MTKEVKHNRDLEWGSYRGTIKLKEMDDMHVVNVTHMLIERSSEIQKRLDELDDSDSDYLMSVLLDRKDVQDQLLDSFYAEMNYRNIPKTALDNAPYPFTDDEGCKRVWNYEKNSFDITPPSVRFIKED